MYKMSWVLDLIEKGMKQLEAEPARAFDASFDMFAEVAAQVPEFKEWREELRATKVTAEDGKTEYHVVQEVMRRAQRPPADSGEAQAAEWTLELIKAQAVRCLEKMHDKKIALADKLESQDGPNCYARNADGHERTTKAHVNNDGVENKFAIADYVMRTFRGISVLNASGIVQQRTAHDFDHPLLIVSDRRKRKTAGAEPESDAHQEAGFFWSVLNNALRSSLVRARSREQPGSGVA
jgi:hypothetical protein